MDAIATLKHQERRDLFEDSASMHRTTPAVIEKDFWVSWALSKIFLDPSISHNLVFKGGTSLSKVYKLIERFSEDIDLVLNWNLITDENPAQQRSKSQQQKFNARLVQQADAYIKGELLNSLTALCIGVCELSPSKESCIINVDYPGIFNDEYLRSGIKLEIGPLASMMPSTEHTIRSYVAETHPALFEQSSCSVNVIDAERTFWEKILILHQEHHRPKDKPQPTGYSRHFYDVAKMAAHAVKDNALLDTQLRDDVIAFKQQHYPRAWARYDLAELGSIKLVPESHVLTATKADYSSMQEMFFGDDIPTFESILEALISLETEISLINQT